MTPLRWLEIGMSIISGLLAVMVFSFMILFPTRPVFFSVVLGWIFLLSLILRILVRRNLMQANVALLCVTTTISCVLFIGLTEWRPLQAALILFSGSLTGFFISLGVRGKEETVFEYKRARRLLMMVWVLNALAFASAFFALHIFFPNAPLWILLPCGGALYAYCTLMIWRLYLDTEVRALLPWAALFFLVMIELLWILSTLPFGYFALAILATWLWYLLQLFARFHFSEHGILWRKQRWFLLWNAVFYILFLAFFVRWV